MKKQKGIFIICLCLCLAIISSQTVVLCAEPVPVFEVEIPDPVLKNEIIRSLRLQDKSKITNIDLLRLISITGSYKPYKDLTGLEYATNLESIFCLHGQITSLESLKNCSKLQEVNCSYNEITSLKGLENKTKLRMVTLEANKIEDVTALENDFALKYVVLTTNQIVSLKGLENKPNLESIDVQCNQIEDLTPLENNVNLRAIDFKTNKVSSLKPLENMVHLTYIRGEYNQITDLAPLQNCSELSRLEAKYNQIFSLKGLENKQKLEYLSLEQNKISDLTPLKSNSNLRDVRLDGNQIKTLEGLEDKSKITQLDLDNNQITDLTVLKNNSGLVHVLLGNNQIISLEGLENKQKLERLYLDNNKVESLAPLEDCSALRAISLANNQVSDLSPLKSCSKLEKIRVDDNHISSVKELDDLNLLVLHAFNQTIEQEVVVVPNKPLVVQNIVQGASLTKSLEEISWIEPNLGENPYNGVYDRGTNTITWGNIPPDVNELIYSFQQFDGSNTPIENVVSGKELYFQGKVKIKLIHSPNTAPEITASDRVLAVGDDFNPLEGVVAIDKEDGEIAVTGSSIVYNDVDTTKAGVYQVIYKVVDQGGMSTTKSISVRVNPRQVEFNTAPVIEVSDKVLTLGDKFDPLEGVVATDKEDGEIIVTGSSIVYNNVDITKVGVYSVIYKVVNQGGISTTKSISVRVNPRQVEFNTAPVIEVSDKVLTLGDKFDPLEGVVATDKEDGEIVVTSSNIIYNNVDMTKAGTYYILYKVSDKNGASTVKNRIVYVREKDTIIDNSSSIIPVLLEESEKKDGEIFLKQELREDRPDKKPVQTEDQDTVSSLKGQTIGKIEEDKDKSYHLKGENTGKLEEEKNTVQKLKGQEVGHIKENGRLSISENDKKYLTVTSGREEGVFIPKTNDRSGLVLWWNGCITAISICLLLTGRKYKVIKAFGRSF